YDRDNKPVYLKDIWPTNKEIADAIAQAMTPDMFREKYRDVFRANPRWNEIDVPEGMLYEWDKNSTYIQEPPFFEGLQPEPGDIREIRGARAMALLGDSVTTDHISPAGSIKPDSPAGKYLTERGVKPADFNSYGSRRGNHEVMMRGTFANIRIRNQMVPGVEGGFTKYVPTGEVMPIYDACMKYAQDEIGRAHV